MLFFSGVVLPLSVASRVNGVVYSGMNCAQGHIEERTHTLRFCEQRKPFWN